MRGGEGAEVLQNDLFGHQLYEDYELTSQKQEDKKRGSTSEKFQ